MPCTEYSFIENTLRQLKGSRMIKNINILVSDDTSIDDIALEGCFLMTVDGLSSSAAIRDMACRCTADFALVFLKTVPVTLGQ